MNLSQQRRVLPLWLAALGGIAIGATSEASAAWAGEPGCRPGALIEGSDELLVKAVRAHLEARGLSSPAPGCPRVLAEITARPRGRLLSKLISPEGAEETRELDGSALAATWIETWVRRDLVSDLLSPAAPSPSSPVDATPTPTAAPPAASSPATSFLLGGEVGYALAGDGSQWADLSLRGCKVVRRACVGVELRGTIDTLLTGDSARLDTRRGGFDALMIGTIAIDARSFIVRPTAAIGAGWFRREYIEDDLGANIIDDTVGARLNAGVELGFPVGHGAEINVGFSGVVAPLARSRPGMEQGFLIAGEPVFRGRFGGGMRFEAP